MIIEQPLPQEPQQPSIEISPLISTGPVSRPNAIFMQIIEEKLEAETLSHSPQTAVRSRAKPSMSGSTFD
jgi:hypothetical protein